MKAVIEEKDGLFLIRIYGSDNLPCDAYVVDSIHYGKEGKRVDKILEEVKG